MELMSIGEFARLSRLSAKALRLYDELGLLPPARVDPDSGYRWYAAGQLDNALAGVTQLAAGRAESMALRSDGALLVWGSEYYGLRGDGIPRGSNSNLPVPTPVTPVSGVTRIALAGGTVLVLAYAEIMPDVVGELRASALGQLHALGLSVQELSVPDPDRRCPHVGLVESQSPPPGSAVLPGGHATIHVYVTAQGGCL